MLAMINQLTEETKGKLPDLLTRYCRSARGAKPLEVIGTYNPLPIARHGIPDHLAPPRPFKDITLDKARARYWLGVGAQASDPVWKLLNMVSRETLKNAERLDCLRPFSSSPRPLSRC